MNDIYEIENEELRKLLVKSQKKCDLMYAFIVKEQLLRYQTEELKEELDLKLSEIDEKVVDIKGK